MAEIQPSIHNKDVIDYIRVVLDRKRTILRTTAVIFCVAVVVSMILPKSYQAVARVLPPQQEQGLLGAMISQSVGISSAAKDIFGTGTPADLYAGMLTSETIKDALIDRFNLMTVYRQKYRIDTYKRLEKFITVEVGKKDGIITVKTEAKDPQLAATLANAAVEELGKLSVKLAVSGAEKNQAYLEERLAKSKVDLANAEDAMKEFLSRNKAIDVSEQARGTIHSVAQLKAQLALQEVLLNSARSRFTDSSQEVKSLKVMVAGLQSQIAQLEGNLDGGSIPAVGTIPALGQVYLRLLRNLKMQEVFVELLTKQYEQASFTAAKNIPGIQVIQYARVPDKKAKPKRTLIVLAATFAGLLYSIGMVFVSEYFESLPLEEKARWQEVRADLRFFTKKSSL